MRRGGAHRANPIGIVLPIIIAIIILVIIAKAITGSSSGTGSKEAAPGTAFVNVIPKPDAKVNIFMSSDTQTELK